MANYDVYQFDKKAHAVAENTKIAWSDFERMHTQSLGATRERKWIPAWAMNDIQMRHVLAQRCWFYCNEGRRAGPRRSRVPDELINDRVALAKLTDNVVPLMKMQLKNLSPAQAQIRDSHLAVRMRYGYLDLECAIVYRAYRLEESSVQISAALGIAPCCVRVHLSRLNSVAKFLGYETHVPHWTKGTKSPRKKRGVNWNITEAIAMRMAGLCFREIGARLGVSDQTVGDTFREWGIVVPFLNPAPIPRKRIGGDRIDTERAAQLRATGMTWKQVTFALGRKSELSVVAAVKHAGLWVPSANRKPAQLRLRI